jgi:hypothetical protein
MFHTVSRKRINVAWCKALWAVFVPSCLWVLLGNVIQGQAQRPDNNIEEIRRLYKEVNQQIAAAENEKPYSTIFCDELTRNVNENPWPAIGIFKSVAKAYYTFSRREGEPYPNKLLQISVTTQRSDRQEYAEYLFNSAGQLVFCFERQGEDPAVETRYYFANNRPISFTRDQKTLRAPTGNDLKAARQAMAEGLRLKGQFVLG